MYSESEATDQTAQELAEEIIREKLWQTLNQEIPYGLKHKITKWEMSPAATTNATALLEIECDVIVARQHLKAIVIGKDGASVRRVAEGASAELQKRFQRRVSLKIRVVAKAPS